MQCDICAKKKATVHLTEIVDEQMTEMHLCEECAHQKSAQMEQQFGLADLLAGLSTAPTGKDSKEGAILCPSCGLNYEDFRKFGRLGCSQCYVAFKEHLSGLLRKIHGSNRHLGKVPYSLKAQASSAAISTPAALLASENLDDLKKQLHSAITAEDFEKAAMLRDKIKGMENS